VSEKRPTLVITGATGFIGRHIASYFVERDWHVVALVRNSPDQHLKNVLYSKYDLASGEEAIIPDEVDAFIHAGYIKNEKGVDAFQLNVNSAKQLLQTFKTKNVKQHLFLSSLSADKNALSVYGKQKAAIEELFLNKKGVVVRAGLVLGDGGLFESMRNYLKYKKLIPLFGNGNQPLQTVYIDDLVAGIFQIISKNLEGTFVIATHEPVPYKQFYRDLAQTAGIKPTFIRVPFWLAGMAIGLGNFLGMKMPVTKDNLLGLKQMKQISSADDLKKIGVKLRDYRESFSAIGASPQTSVR
jgi:UDP-glucose 4-epimerase